MSRVSIETFAVRESSVRLSYLLGVGVGVGAEIALTTSMRKRRS
jgi:hypothetical protein